jgi:hypothetical protein
MIYESLLFWKILKQQDDEGLGFENISSKQWVVTIKQK